MSDLTPVVQSDKKENTKGASLYMVTMASETILVSKNKNQKGHEKQEDSRLMKGGCKHPPPPPAHAIIRRGIDMVEGVGGKQKGWGERTKLGERKPWGKQYAVGSFWN